MYVAELVEIVIKFTPLTVCYKQYYCIHGKIGSEVEVHWELED